MPKRSRLKPKRDTPLIDPAASSLILILPSEQHISGSDASTRTDHQKSVLAIAAAADIADVPTFALSQSSAKRKQPLLELLPTSLAYRLFTSDQHISPWSNEAFTEALDTEDRSVLVIAGLWLEYDVLTTALHALTHGYDTYIALDATPARSRTGAQLSWQRLLQFGATPVMSSQVIHEWCLEVDDSAKRAALSKLFATLINS